MNTIASSRRSLLVTILVSGAASTIQAAVITWGAAQNISGDSDVSTNGTLVEAYNFGGIGVSGSTVNGVNFSAFAISSGSIIDTVGGFTMAGTKLVGVNDVGSGAVPFSALSAPYQALLQSVAGQDTTPGSFTLTFAGLTVGTSYELQWWTSISIAAGNRVVTAAAGGSVALNTNAANLRGGLGQFSIGSFIADNATQVITFGSPQFASITPPSSASSPRRRLGRRCRSRARRWWGCSP